GRAVTATELAYAAGELGVGLADTMPARDLVVLGDEAGGVARSGMKFLTRLGVDLAGARAKRRAFCRPCLDWTERRPHIGVAVGTALAKHCFELKWIERARGSRALTITRTSRQGLMEQFALSIQAATLGSS